ncbi:C1QL [Mytilus coruscus]|uniref:C1QL n=1 Tax=Mytilus coruscus TaxID=42192 RepID=A0A6J8C2N4_MYTCO|nr:C1QL [Mytilus coruscus]
MLKQNYKNGKRCAYDACPQNDKLLSCIRDKLKPQQCDEICSCNCEDRKVGFLATLSKSLEDIGMHATVVYDAVKTNIGGGYDPITGIFTSPSDGLYYFTWTTLTEPKGSFITSLQHNNNAVVGNHARANGLDEYLPSSQSAVVQMKKGETVYIRTWAQGQYLSGFWSSFSGFEI